MARHLVGLSLVVLFVVGAYFAWRAAPDVIRRLPQGETRTVATDLRLLIEALLLFLAVSVVDRLWRAVVGEPEE